MSKGDHVGHLEVKIFSSEAFQAYVRATDNVVECLQLHGEYFEGNLVHVDD